MKKGRVLSIFALLICCIFAFSGCGMLGSASSISTGGNSQYVSQYQENQPIIVEEGSSAAEIAQKYIDVSFTVLIYQVTEVNGGSSKSMELSSYGSGFVVHTGGFILTNYHVIEDVLADPVSYGATKVYYECYVSQDGGETYYPAEILWENSVFDMAIIICEEFASLPAAKLKDRTIYCSDEERIGLLEQVITVGNQKSYHASATIGNISSTILRVATSETNVYEHLIQHNASINHGNSGGALIDMDGNVIGLNTLGDDDANSLFFAVSIYPAIAVLDKVVENYYATGSKTEEIVLGFTGTDSVLDSMSQTSVGFEGEGLYVTGVESSCLISGLKVGDVIVEVKIQTSDGTETFEVWDNNSFRYARLNLLYAQNATFKVNRGGNIVELAIIN